jgi:hypothetical protein
MIRVIIVSSEVWQNEKATSIFMTLVFCSIYTIVLYLLVGYKQDSGLSIQGDVTL